MISEGSIEIIKVKVQKMENHKKVIQDCLANIFRRKLTNMG